MFKRVVNSNFVVTGIFLHTAYTEIGGDEELPLGEEFQEHLRRFLRPSEKKVQKKVELVRKLVSQLS